MSSEQLSALPDTVEALKAGLDHHQAGRLAEATARYLEIVREEPQHPDALHLLGVVAQQQGDLPVAVQLIEAAIQINPQAAHYHNNLGNTYRLQGNTIEAIASYRRAIALDPANIAIQHSLANLLAESGKFEEAASLYQRVLNLEPQLAEAHYNFGNLQKRLGNLPAAIACYRRAIELKADCPEFHFNLAVALHHGGFLRESAESYRQVVALRPDDAEAHYSLGAVLQELDELKLAAACYERALQLKPDYREAYSNLAVACVELGELGRAAELYAHRLQMEPDNAVVCSNLGVVYKELGNLKAAADLQRRALLLNPEMAAAHNNLGVVLARQGDSAGALSCYRRAVALKPDYARALCNIGVQLSNCGDLAGAADYYQRALKCYPEFATARFQLGIVHLLQGNFSVGWEEYESRWDTKQLHPAKRKFPQPLWQGEPLDGARILLHAEQGLGDTMQFVRYVPLVAARGGQVILEVRAELRRLLEGTAGALEMVTRGQALPDFAWHCPLLSLPRAFQTGLQNVPADVPYLKADPVAADAWAQRLAHQGLRIGLVWGGAATHPYEQYRSIPLAQLAPLTQVAGVTFYSLQKGPATRQLKDMRAAVKLIDLDPMQADFTDTAAIIANLDLVISIDTSVAHLAGAMGKPVWVLLHHVPDWRWLLDREDSPWYPTARLFRQSRLGEWQDVVDRLGQELRILVSNR